MTDAPVSRPRPTTEPYGLERERLARLQREADALAERDRARREQHARSAAALYRGAALLGGAR